MSSTGKRGWGLLLEDYIESLLRNGKGSKHEDFQVLFRVFGKERIIKEALEAKKRLREKEENEKV